jgi:DNA mismatch repair protein MutS
MSEPKPAPIPTSRTDAASAATAKLSAAPVTPMMAQYNEIKAANPGSLLFYRMGDFYELFFHDAEIASRTLGIVLTKRGKHQGDDIPMCGVPVERADDYLQRLIAAGHRVAVCEQTEDPAEAKKRGAKSVVRRDVVRLVTPGTLTEETLLDPGAANWLAAIARIRRSDGGWLYGFAACDISTGQFVTREIDELALGAEIARYMPRELLVPDSLLDEKDLRALWRETGASLTPLAKDGFDFASSEKRLTDYFGVKTLAGFGTLGRCEIIAAATVVLYVERTQLGARPPLSPPQSDSSAGGMRLDAATRANLELTRTLSGDKQGSLLAILDRTITPGGARLLAERLSGPLTDPALINQRLESVAFFLREHDLRGTLRRCLKGAPDLARALSRLAMGRGGPRDLAAMRDGLLAMRDIDGFLKDTGLLCAEIKAACQHLHHVDPVLHQRLDEALSDSLPLKTRDGGFIKQGYLAELDETRSLRDESRQVIAGLQAQYADLTGARTLRIKHNNFLGYFVEVPQSIGEELVKPPHQALFVHRQTMQGAMRFSTTELGALESKIASAADRALALELSLFDELTSLILSHETSLKHAADAMAVLDVAAALAERAEEGQWTRPTIDDSLAFDIKGGRHPVVEAALKRDGHAFVANTTNLGLDDGTQAGCIALMTGPNMAGKSTFLRQNALLAILAQMGSFVPAEHAHIGLIDRLFSRVGAADDLARGRSTFMVEMIETATILNQATERSLVILDEIGRGTATYDGLSIAWATIEHLHERNRCRGLFATHFHELTALAQKLVRLRLLTLRVADHQGEVIFLHEVIHGTADRSYGIQVARLAGLPQTVIERARVILEELEAQDRGNPIEKMVDDLPLFSVQIPVATASPQKPDPMHEAVSNLDPDQMTPREAMDALYQLKALLKH